MGRTCLGKYAISSDTTAGLILTHIRTPKALDESLPNAQRGIFHIQNAQYWAFYNLEYGKT